MYPFAKAPPPTADLKDTKENISAMLAAVGISLPIPRPLFTSPPDAKALQAWVKCHEYFPEVQQIAAKLAKHLNHIDFEKFMRHLQITVGEFNKQNVPYILWIPQRKGYFDDGCSDLWVAGLALEYCQLKPPVAITFTDDLMTVLQENPNVKDILLLDDASYSANHITRQIKQVMHMAGVAKLRTLHIGVPFMTTHAVAEIQKWSVKTFKTTMLLAHTIMPTMKEILADAEVAYLVDNFDYQLSSCTLTYFDHQYPDIQSSLQNFKEGNHLLILNIFEAMKHLRGHLEDIPHPPGKDAKQIEKEAWNNKVAQLLPSCSMPIIPRIIAPYKLHAKLLQLKGALAAGEMGIRTAYPVPAQLQRLFNDADIHVDKPVQSVPADAKASGASAAVSNVASQPADLSVAQLLPMRGFFKPRPAAILIAAGVAATLILAVRSLNFENLSRNERLGLACMLIFMLDRNKEAQPSPANAATGIQPAPF